MILSWPTRWWAAGRKRRVDRLKAEVRDPNSPKFLPSEYVPTRRELRVAFATGRDAQGPPTRNYANKCSICGEQLADSIRKVGSVQMLCSGCVRVRDLLVLRAPIVQHSTVPRPFDLSDIETAYRFGAFEEAREMHPDAPLSGTVCEVCGERAVLDSGVCDDCTDLYIRLDLDQPI